MLVMERKSNNIIRVLAGFAGAIIVLTGVFNLCIYEGFFKANFGRATKERTVEHEREFFASDENYSRHLADVEKIESLELPLIEMTSYDGLKLKAILWEAEKADCRGSILLMHGFHSAPLREFATLALFYHELGLNVVMPYQRAHGLSEGKYLTFGIKERYDCHDWIVKINSLYGEDSPVFVSGISMGGATVTMSAGLELPPNVRGIIADCGFTAPYEIIRWTAVNAKHIWPGVADIMITSLEWYCEHFAGFSLKEYSTYKAMNSTNLPFLFITGTKDETVPCEMTMSSFMLYKQRCPDKTKIVFFEDGPHAISYLMDEAKYKKEVKNFIEKYL